MSSMEIFELVTWIKKKQLSSDIGKNALDLMNMANKELPFTSTYHHVLRVSKELNLYNGVNINLDNEELSKRYEELLTRVKRVEKFLTKYFAEEWGSLL